MENESKYRKAKMAPKEENFLEKPEVISRVAVPHQLNAVRIRIQLFTSMRIRILLKSDANQILLVYRTCRAPFLASTPPLRLFMSLHGFILIHLSSQILTLIRIRIQLFILMRIRIQLSKIVQIRIRIPGYLSSPGGFSESLAVLHEVEEDKKNICL